MPWGREAYGSNTRKEVAHTYQDNLFTIDLGVQKNYPKDMYALISGTYRGCKITEILPLFQAHRPLVRAVPDEQAYHS